MGNLIAEVDARAEGQAGHAVAVRAMFDRISPTYDLLNRLLSAGIDRRWRERALLALAQDLPDGPILDVCAGTLDLAQAIERKFAGRRLLASDFAREMLLRGRDKVSATALSVGDAMRLPVRDGCLAGMTCGFGVRNLAEPEVGLREAYRVLKPRGRFVVLEFYRPSTWAMRLFHGAYARFVLPAVGYLVSRDREAYGYLSRSMRGFYSRSEYEELARSVGFSEVRGWDLSFGIASLVCMVR